MILENQGLSKKVLSGQRDCDDTSQLQPDFGRNTVSFNFAAGFISLGLIGYLLKNRKHAQNGMAYAKPHVTKDLITFQLYQNWTLKLVYQKLLNQH